MGKDKLAASPSIVTPNIRSRRLRLEAVKRSLEQVFAATAQFPKTRPVDFAIHLLAFAILMPSCIPLEEIWPTEGRWNEFPWMASAYAVVRVFRLVLRCAVFPICIMRFMMNGSVASRGAVNHGIEAALGTIWPADHRASVALLLFAISRCLKLLRLPMEAIILDFDDFGPCAMVALVQGMWSRASWIIGLALGFHYFTDPEVETSADLTPKSKDNAGCVHPRIWKMIQSNTFQHHARLTAVVWILISVAECYLLFHWEAGLPSTVKEIDAFRFRKDFYMKYSPNFAQWSLSRVVVGSWREPFYCIMIFPLGCLAFTFIAALSASLSPIPRVKHVAKNCLLGAASYIFLTSAHNLQFLILCLLVSWECYVLQEKCEEYQEAFGQLSSTERVQQHDALGKDVGALDRRLKPIIVYFVIERAMYMSTDVVMWRCESAPFTWLHYVFRHLVRFLGVALVIWRIGRLNASIYDDFSGKVAYELMRSHQHESDDDEAALRKHRWELKDWMLYLQHNSNGRRKYCLRVCSFQCCVRAHTVAFWVVTVVLFPFGQRLFALLPSHPLLLI